MQIKFDLPHAYWRVLFLRSKEIEENEKVKYDPNILCKDLAIGFIQKQPEFQKALKILGRNKDKFEV